MSQRRSDWEAIHALIEAAFYTLLADKKRIPTQEELATYCQVDRQTIHRHMKEMSLDKITRRPKLLGERVLMGMADAGMKGDARAARLYFEVVYKWAPKITVEVTNVDELSDEAIDRKISELLAQTGTDTSSRGEAASVAEEEVEG